MSRRKTKIRFIKDILNTELVWMSEQTSSYPRKLKLLLVSDTHMNVQKIQSLRCYYSKYLLKNKGAKPSEEYKEKGIQKFNKQLEQIKITHFDYVIHGGDFDNLLIEQTTDPNYQTKSITNITSCLASLQNFHCPVLYVPGNHDPNCLFDEDPQKHKMLTGRSLNLHNSIIELQEDLVVIGLGGSVPCFQIQKDGTLKQIWDAFPWGSQEQYSRSLRKLIKDAQDYYLDRSQKTNRKLPQLVILSHIGPLSSSTTLQTHQCIKFKSQQMKKQMDNQQNQKQEDFPATDAGLIITGSKTLDQIIINEQCKLNIIANIHGHSHMASSSRMGRFKTTIIGPGSLNQGDFSELTLLKQSEESEWKIGSLKLINI